MTRDLKKSILQTLSYFDIFDFPLTANELYTWLWGYEKKIDFVEFYDQLDGFVENGYFSFKFGYYFLNGRGKNISKRESSVKHVEQKIKIAKFGCKLIKNIPFVRAVFVCNTVASLVADEDSDIDLFIITKKKRLWLTRLLVTLTLSLFGLRRTKKRVKNKLCLSFYLSDNSLGLEEVRIDGKQDVYLTYWIDQLVPIYDPDNLKKKILQHNSWVFNFIQNAGANMELGVNWSVNDSKYLKIVKKTLEKMWQGSYGGILESNAKEIQLLKMKINTASLKDEPDSRVIINDKMLKFHECDRRKEYKDQWLKNFEKATV